MALPKNGVAKEIRSYAGSLFIFLFVIGIIVTLLQFPVLDSNKEVVMMLIGTIAASIPVIISSITVGEKDRLERMVIDLQKQMLENQDAVMDKIILKAAMDFDDLNHKCSCKDK
jgi:hypothetical protein